MAWIWYGANIMEIKSSIHGEAALTNHMFAMAQDANHCPFGSIDVEVAHLFPEQSNHTFLPLVITLMLESQVGLKRLI